MSTAYTDSAGNVTSSIADDVASFTYALRAAQAVPGSAAPSCAAVNGTKLVGDSLTGLPAGSATLTVN
jgi:hypothetical protein